MTAGLARDAPAAPVTAFGWFSRTAVLAGLLAFVGSLALFGLRYLVVEPPTGDAPKGDRAFVTLYDPPVTKMDTIIDVADGQAWAALAHDPTASRPGQFYDGTAEFVYRAQRPAFGWFLWALSGGQAGLIPAALVIGTCLGVAAQASTSVALARSEGRIERWAGYTVLMPGTIYIALTLGPEPFAIALCILGLLWWRGPVHLKVGAVILFSLAVLTRDVLVMVPLTIALYDLVRRRARLVSILPLAVPAVVFAVWVASLHARWGAWPWQVANRQNLSLPFVGLGKALGQLDLVVASALAIGAVLLILALRRSAGSLLTWIAVAFALQSLVYGDAVWTREPYRVLLPMYVFAFVAALPRVRTPARPRTAGTVDVQEATS